MENKRGKRCTIFSVYNNKGGVGKTHLCVNLACIYALNGKRVLLVDLDPQSNATHFLLRPGFTAGGTITDLLRPDSPVRDLHMITYPVDKMENLFYIPASPELEDSEAALNAVHVLEEAGVDHGQKLPVSDNRLLLSYYLEKLRNDYDYIIIDTHPSQKRLLNLNALAASDYFFCPVDSDPESFEGMNGLMESFRVIVREVNPQLRFGGVIYMKFRNTNADFKALRVLSESMVTDSGESLLLDTMIPLRAKAVDTRWVKSSLALYAPKDECTKAYKELADEMEKRMEG